MFFCRCGLFSARLSALMYFYCLIVAGWFAASVAAGKNLPRFEAALADGSRISGESITDWFKTDGMPKLDGQSLLDPARPLRWLRDRTLVPGDVPPAFVEFFSGDRLPGEVLGYRSTGTDEVQFAHLVVSPAVRLRPTRQLEAPQIRVLLRYVRRLVWQRRSLDRYEPGQVFFRDGRSTAFRAVRFREDHVLLLGASGTQRVEFAEIAELHMPETDFWERWLDELAVLSPACDKRLWQVESIDGLVATSSAERLLAYSWGSAADSNRWVHGIQPGWSLDVLWVPWESVWIRRSFAPFELPLSRLPPRVSVHRTRLGAAAWPARVNRNVHGGLMHGGDKDFGWGFGVQAYSELRFPLSDLVSSFRGAVGLDHIVGDGGCASVRVEFATIDGPPAYESPLLVGSRSVLSFGSLDVPPAAAELVLIVDPAHERRPPGGDPFEIRDSVDWFEPLLLLDEAKLRTRVAERLPAQIAAWADWRLETAATARFSSELRDVPSGSGSFEQVVSAADRPFILSRRVNLAETGPWLMLGVSQSKTSDARPKLRVRLDGEIVFEREVPYRERWREPLQPMVIPLTAYQSSGVRELQVEIRQLAGADVPIHWQSLEFSHALPLLRTIFEDVGELTALDAQEPAVIQPQTDAAFSGRAGVRLPAERRFRLNVPDSPMIRERPGRNEFRFLRFAFRKLGAGRVCVELDHANAEQHPARLDAGLGEPSYSMARRVWDRRLADEWVVITRDLYADFGTFQLQSLTLSAPDGEAVMFDHLYLARNVDDFQFIDVPPLRLPATEAARQAAIEMLKAKSACCVAIEFADGRVGSGCIISGDGFILTAGHLMGGPGQSATVHLADGSIVKATTRGIQRDWNLGLLKTDSAATSPAVGWDSAPAISLNQLFLAVAYPAGVLGGKPPVAEIVEVPRVLSNSLLTRFSLSERMAGGPVLNEAGNLVGVLGVPSSLGGSIAGRVHALNQDLPKLRNGEILGRWLAGTGPLIGLRVQTTADGCRVQTVVPGLPGELAGVQVGDVIRTVREVRVTTLDEIYETIADLNAGDEVSVQLLRTGQPLTVQLRLAPR